MTCKELTEYLSCFKQDDEVCVLVVDPIKRLLYEVSKIFMIEDAPALFFEVHKAEALDSITDCGAREDGEGYN